MKDFFDRREPAEEGRLLPVLRPPPTLVDPSADADWDRATASAEPRATAVSLPPSTRGLRFGEDLAPQQAEASSGVARILTDSGVNGAENGAAAELAARGEGCAVCIVAEDGRLGPSCGVLGKVLSPSN